MKPPLEEDQCDGKAKFSTTSLLKNSNQLKCLTLTDINESIIKAKENNTEAQNHLMEIYYRGLYQDVLKPGNIGFLSWNNGEIEEIVNKDDLYIFYVISNFRNTIGGIRLKFNDFLETTKNRATNKHACAQNNLAWMYENGFGGLFKDEARAAELYYFAACQGFLQAQYNLANMYNEGRGGLIKYPQEAARLYKLAADHGNASAQLKLGSMYENGLADLPKDATEAVRLYKLSANQGNAYAQIILGWMHEIGRGVAKPNLEEAVRLYKDAADQGNAYAQTHLGRMHQKGLGGLDKNAREALRWWLKSKTPQAKTSILSLLTFHLPFAPPSLQLQSQNHKNMFLDDLMAEINRKDGLTAEIKRAEIIKDLEPLVRTYQIKKEENNPEGSNKFFIPQLYSHYVTLEEVTGVLLGYVQCLNAGCLMKGFTVTPELRSSISAKSYVTDENYQKIQCDILAFDRIETDQQMNSIVNPLVPCGGSIFEYITIGVQNVDIVQKVMRCLMKYPEVDKILETLSQFYKKSYEISLADSVSKQVAAQSTKDPSLNKELQKLSHTIIQCKEAHSKIENERTCLKEIIKNIHLFIRTGALKRTQDFFEDERYSFLK